ncbi:MAG: DUF1906 domain-containing protein, partial [Actinomycetota bacterium]|nr:DUF1906 domain-containing protein [Actinomycetota bacterium]
MPLNALTRRLAVAVATVATALGSALFWTAPAQADGNPVTPGDFTGYAFDQCLAPNQSAMTTWMNTSPFLAVGIYISGASRGCPSQPNLTPAWVQTQLAAGWRLLPITLGPQAWCTTRQRYLHQVRINPSPSGTYSSARTQGRAEADKTAGVAKSLGIVAGSTLWYDIEAFDIGSTDCRESAIYFLQGWTNRMHELNYVSGVYSSAASGMKMLDNARRTTPTKYTLPDRIWIADWNGTADVRSSYIADDGWMPHQRMHQYRGGHNETYGGVTISIDNNWVDLGRGSYIDPEPYHCGTSFNFPSYSVLSAGTTETGQVKALQCMLKNRGLYSGPINGSYSRGVINAVHAYRTRRGWGPSDSWTKSAWMTILTEGARPVLK